MRLLIREPSTTSLAGGSIGYLEPVAALLVSVVGRSMVLLLLLVLVLVLVLRNRGHVKWQASKQLSERSPHALTPPLSKTRRPGPKRGLSNASTSVRRKTQTMHHDCQR